MRSVAVGRPRADVDQRRAVRRPGRPRPARGRGVIALQLHSGGPTEVRFRNFELARELEPDSLNGGGGDYPSSTGGKAAGEIRWKKMPLDNKFRGEGVAVADFNNDA